MGLDEYKEHVLEINEVRATNERLTLMHEDLNRTLWLLLNELHKRHDLAEFTTYANDHQDRVRIDISNGIVSLRFLNNEDSNTEDQESDEEPIEVPQWNFGYNEEGT